MSAHIELTIHSTADDGGNGGGWLELTQAAQMEDGKCCTLDDGALDLLEAILRVRREGIYRFFTDYE